MPVATSSERTIAGTLSPRISGLGHNATVRQYSLHTCTQLVLLNDTESALQFVECLCSACKLFSVQCCFIVDQLRVSFGVLGRLSPRVDNGLLMMCLDVRGVVVRVRSLRGFDWRFERAIRLMSTGQICVR